VCRPSEERVVALELELVPAISFVGDALLTGSDGRRRGSRCSEVRWWREDGMTARSVVLPVIGCVLLCDRS
jgi:hypothetical protein